ncbi:MAG: glycerophosphodiester phosphodiesterase [Glaciimonas sp.]|nr:glycerophosphodiester phosphodiesterase [Glaciimonas sp.]
MWPYPKIVAHRGGGALAPENTLAAMRCGLAHGFHAVEFDVMLSRDAIPVLMHDEQFGRTVSGVGSVPTTSALELAGLDAGSWFGDAFAGEPVPSYAQVAAFCRAQAIWMNVEIKPAVGFEVATGRVTAALTRQLFAAEIATAGVASRALPLFSSFSFEALMAARAAAPEIPRGYLVDTIPADWHARLVALAAVALHTNHQNLSRKLAQQVKAAGYGLFCYTVNDPARATEILSWGVDGFCTDRIDLIGADFSLGAAVVIADK